MSPFLIDQVLRDDFHNPKRYTVIMIKYKRYIKVKAVFSKEGQIMPISIYWDNDVEYEIDQVQRISKAASSVGGAGIRYECMIRGQKRIIFMEHTNQWFIESEKP